MRYLISLETLDGCTFPIPNVIQFCLTYVNVQCHQRLIKELCDDHFSFFLKKIVFLIFILAISICLIKQFMHKIL